MDGDEQQRRPVVDLAHQQSAADVERDVERRIHRRRHLDALERHARARRSDVGTIEAWKKNVRKVPESRMTTKL